ncbi:MAG: OmpH family outer membrane protein [Halobacteriovoraceae bacterium]|nr:OmpH family outer membrane protein [Halobacteriovoraceae bacterium]
MKLIALISCFFICNNAFAVNVGLIDFQKILLTVKQGAKIKSKLKKEYDKKQNIIKKEENKIRKMQKELKKQSLVMKTTTRAKKEEAIQMSILALQRKSVGFTKEMEQMEQKLKRPIIDRAKKIIDAVSKEAAVDITFEKNSSGAVYVKSGKDLTDLVIKLYNKKHPK